ncbi:type II toxin-antitoxin system PemI/MazE family antitoxin [Lactobacillus hominis]|uniref:G5JQ72 (Toxin-antitoxin system, antitoxin component, AbrB family) n=1 Tax=Lactobacillus hominis DSM 23910 = CRBIP 24.179 TaxID=1423758 RepID=I7L4T5_9LACO|nr:hypothetical protein [Lactobacillus hominis]KRM86085.1 hypothetical protein FC41_GL000278 [Lactobacillus hominis DSM 23910 = CRBIP 24.179]MCT3348691.1 hypothetical protein [Lactobacillus hominis]CCI80957.1 G5JQ72 (Toxin-antitoxin system, antitoxin component, AbrB family) [Lactobacillus hominis DSM 23910 = CRBIP 24.179]
MLIEIKSKKIGNSISLTLPKSLKIDVDQVFVVTKMHNGALILTPKIENPYGADKQVDMRDPEGDYFEEQSIQDWQD